jgi:hypothetical protein
MNPSAPAARAAVIVSWSLLDANNQLVMLTAADTFQRSNPARGLQPVHHGHLQIKGAVTDRGLDIRVVC